MITSPGLENQIFALIMMRELKSLKKDSKSQLIKIIEEYQEELQMSVDIYQFPHCLNIARRLAETWRSE